MHVWDQHSKMVSGCDSPEVQPRLEDQVGQSCLGIPACFRQKKYNCHTTDTAEYTVDEGLNTQTSLLTVSPLCPGCPGSPSFPAGP